MTQATTLFLAACLGLLGALLAPADASQLKVTPVQKVIQMLQGMVEKGKEEKHAEQQQYAGYSQFCSDTSASKARAIEEATNAIEKLEADIGKYASDAETLSTEIAEHEQDIAQWTKDQEASTKVREIEHSDFLVIRKDYAESLDALTRAVEYLKVRSKATPGVAPADAELLQQVYKFAPEDLKHKIDAFLNTDPAVGAEASDARAVRQGESKSAGLLEVSQPTPNAYEFQSQGIIDMLEKLKDKFQNEVDSVEQQEVDSRQAYDLLMTNLRDQINSATDDVATKTRLRVDKLEAKALAESDLAETQATKDDDVKYKADLDATCELKAKDFEARQQLRGEEIEALEKAIEILSGDSVSGAAETHLPTLLQKKQTPKASLVQLRSSVVVRSPSQLRLAEFLKERAQKLNSKVLSTLAVAASADPFAKVKQLIQQLITKLMEEANEEAEHKGFCDQELATNAQTRKKKTEQIELLNSEIDELNASITQLTTEIGDLSAEVADLDAAVAENTKIREEEKTKNAATIKDAQEAQEAVAQALSVLKEFYAKAGEATAALLQKKRKQQPEAPEIFDAPYKGMGAESGGVVGMIEVIQSDFARLESETTAAEAQAAKEYDAFMSDSSVSKAQKTKDLEHKTTKRQNQEGSLVEKKEDLKLTEEELDKAMQYYEELKPTCLPTGMSYEERVARRQEEIESLQEALKILSGEDIAGAP